MWVERINDEIKHKSRDADEAAYRKHDTAETRDGGG